MSREKTPTKKSTKKRKAKKAPKLEAPPPEPKLTRKEWEGQLRSESTYRNGKRFLALCWQGKKLEFEWERKGESQSMRAPTQGEIDTFWELCRGSA